VALSLTGGRATQYFAAPFPLCCSTLPLLLNHQPQYPSSARRNPRQRPTSGWATNGSNSSSGVLVHWLRRGGTSGVQFPISPFLRHLLLQAGIELKFACMRPALFLAFTAALLPHSSTAQGESGPLSLCQLFQDLDSFAGQRVTLRAAYRYSFEVSGFYSEPCKPPATLDGRDIVPHVYLVFLVSSGSPEPSRSNMERFRQAVKESRNQPLSIVLTVTGVLKTVSQPEPLTGKDGRRFKVRMFGHLGAIPAQLGIESINAVEVSTNADAPANFDLKKR
jgi:hypothetical protein